MSAGLDAIKRNANSLISDAELLFNNERWARAAALAILAIEEVGKYYMFHSGSAPSAESYRGHFSKQEKAARVYKAGVLLTTFETFLEERGFKLKLASNLSEWEKNWYESDEGNLIREKLTNDAAVHVSERLQKGAEVTFFQSVLNKSLLAQKNAAFYVDLDNQGNVSSNPVSMTKEDATALLEHARSMVTILFDDRPL